MYKKFLITTCNLQLTWIFITLSLHCAFLFSPYAASWIACITPRVLPIDTGFTISKCDGFRSTVTWRHFCSMLRSVELVRWLITSPVHLFAFENSESPRNLWNNLFGGKFNKPVNKLRRPRCAAQRMTCSKLSGMI